MNYEKVPNIITGKDLDYLNDMFNWNYGAYKSNLNALNEVNDDDIKQIIKESTKMFNEGVMQILTILASGGANE